MYGAILGDIAGSRFEFDRGGWTKDFEFVTDECNWTDDTVMTVAVAEALLGTGLNASVSEIEDACTKAMQRWGRKYPHAGYGNRFIRWLAAEDPVAYGSYGNGSAMRVSAAGWLYESLERTREVARATANVSHNHPEGIKGAECTAAVIWLGRNGSTKDEIKDYVIKKFGYDFSETLEEMRARHRHDESCMDSLPKALRSFFDGESYEDVVRNAVSLGGDTDTIAAIAGAMAEGFYDMPAVLHGECMRFLEADMLDVIRDFEKTIGRVSEDDEQSNTYVGNLPLIDAFGRLQKETDVNRFKELFISFLNVMAEMLSEGATVPMPFVDVNNVMFESLTEAKIGEEVSLKEDVRLKMDTMKDGQDNEWLPLFLSDEDVNKGDAANIRMSIPMEDVLRYGLEWESVQGVVVNPFDKPLVLDKEMLKQFLDDYDKWSKTE